MSEQLLDISTVRIDGDTQPRTAINQAIVAEYAEALQAGADFPAVQVVHDGAAYWLVDGFHRFFAHRRLNRAQIKAEVVAGELPEARWLSLGANKDHGLRRTNEDKVKAVRRALSLRADLSDNAIAAHVGVSPRMVSAHRAARAVTTNDAQSAANPPTPAKRIGRDGRAINTARIGRGRRRHGAPTIAKNACKPVRTGAAPVRMKALNLPYNPEIAADTLIEVFDAAYLRALISFLTKHLEGDAQ